MPPSPQQLGVGESTPLANQVAGHEGVMSDASGSLVIKPALAREIAFYQTLAQASRDDAIYQLKGFVPQFYGTLRLEGQLTPSGGVEKLGGNTPESVVIENLSYAYTHPSILDVKLGTVLHGPDASDEKRARMDKAARETTSAETGLRLTGCQTWHALTRSYILTPKSFGKTISVSQLPGGMVRFFPLPSDVITPLNVPPSPPPTANATTSSTSSAPTPLPPANPASGESLTPPTPVTASAGAEEKITSHFTSHALSPDLLLRVLDILLEEIDRLVAVLQGLEIRFVGSSVLIVYEGEPERLQAALDRYDERRAAKSKGGTSTGAATYDRSAFSDDGSASERSDESNADDDEDDDDVSLDGNRQDAKRARNCPPVTLRMIDFAHTWLAEGEGPDEGVLKGLGTLRGLVDGRRAEVRRSLEGHLEDGIATEEQGEEVTSKEV